MAVLLARNMESLLSLWTHERRAKGGWWALAGFSFQSVLYVLKFFEGVHAGAISPTDIAKTELLSDILVPSDGVYTLIQVKRTLDRTKLRAALREAYEIASLCDAAFLTKLRFRVVCLKRETHVLPKDFPLLEVVGPDGKIEVWNQLLKCFDAADAIAEEPDPLDRLHDFLWHAGIRDTGGFIDSCLGILLRLFGNPTQEAIKQIARDLSHSFHLARNEGYRHINRVGRLLQRNDIALDSRADTDHRILFDRRPQLLDLQLGRVRQRPEIFYTLAQQFDTWWKNIVIADEVSCVPVFWIDGRSGEGKSVLLLQLIQYILLGANSPVVSYLTSPDILPDWIKNQADIQCVAPYFDCFPAVAVIDDLHLIRNREEWEGALRGATDLMPPRVAILGCGPTPECMKFKSDFSTLFEVHNFSVPNLNHAEMRAFGNWYEERTGNPFTLGTADLSNRMLVVWMFELVQGKSVREFSRSFKIRLVEQGLFELARTILAANALELPAPMKLFENLSDSQRDAFLALCSESQLHFEQTDPSTEAYGGYRLSHPQIDWHVYQEWASPPATLAQTWGRDLAQSLVALVIASTEDSAAQLIYRLGISSKLSEEITDSLLTTPGTLDQALRELYCKQTAEIATEESVSLLPRWLDVLFRRPKLRLDPDPIQQAIKLANYNPLPEELHPSVAGWLWRLSEVDAYKRVSTQVRVAAQSIIFGDPERIGISSALTVIASKSEDRQAALQLCKRWLRDHAAHEFALRPLETLISAWPQDGELIEAAQRWIIGNPNHTLVYRLYMSLVAARPDDDKLIANALKWTADNPAHQQAYQLLAALVAARPDDDKLIANALKWTADNPAHQQAYQLLAALVAAQPDNDKLIAAALKWTADNPAHQQAYHLLAALVAARSDDDKLIAAALKWTADNPAHQQAYHLLAALVAAQPDNDKLIAAALKWTADNPAHQQAYNLLAALVAARSDDDKLIAAALKWTADNPAHQQAYNLLAALVAAQPGDERVIDVARRWYNRNLKHPQIYNLLSVLITQSDGAEEWMQQGKEFLITSTGAAKRSVLAALIAGGKAKKHYVNLTLDLIDVETKKNNKNYLRAALSTALANNIQNSLKVIAGQSTTERKQATARALAHGLKKYPNRAEEFLEQINVAPADYVGILLSACIASKVGGELLDNILLRWLNGHRLMRGYGTVLRALKQHPDRLQAVLDIGGLSTDVKLDYQKIE